MVCDSDMQHRVPQGQQGVQNHLWQWGLTVHFNSCFPAPGVLMLVLGHLHTPPRAPRALNSSGSGSRDSYGRGGYRTVLSLLYQHLGHGLPASGPAPGAAGASILYEFLPLLNPFLNMLVSCRACTEREWCEGFCEVCSRTGSCYCLAFGVEQPSSALLPPGRNRSNKL